MENELYQNTMTNSDCANPENNLPKAEYGINRSEQYLSELHSVCDAVHAHCSSSLGQAQVGEIVEEGGQVFYDHEHGHDQHQL